MRIHSATPSHRRRARGFTLIEVILAISIAIAILVAALFFQSQASNLRGQLLDEADRIASIRLVMDRLTTELRAAFVVPQYGFAGDATSMTFVTAAAPALPGRSGGTSARTDLRLVAYSLGRSVEGTNEIVSGLIRSEQPLVEKPVARTAFAIAPAPEATNSPARGPEPLTDLIRFVRIWYWDGSEWSATWNSPDLPRGIEINLGAEPLPEDGALADYPGDLYRRVIYLPASREIDDYSDLFDAKETASTRMTP